MKSDWTNEMLGGAILVFIALAVFGIVNWSEHYVPDPPLAMRNKDVPKEGMEALQAAHQMRMDNVGRDAMVPFVYCPVIAFVGIGGVIGCIVWLIHRNTK